MRIWFSILGAGVLLAAAGMIASVTRAATPAATAVPGVKSAYDFNLTRLDGKPLPLSAYKGKVILLVNTASMCGFTPQYEGLQKLQVAYAPKGFTVVGVPSGDFGGQEYEKAGDIKKFCESTFGITFPLAEKAHVTGPEAAPIYRWAKANLATQNEPKWNFHKFLIGKDGRLIAGFDSRVTPESPELKAAIEAAMKG
jgi:glutathione peroxidase